MEEEKAPEQEEDDESSFNSSDLYLRPGGCASEKIKERGFIVPVGSSFFRVIVVFVRRTSGGPLLVPLPGVLGFFFLNG